MPTHASGHKLEAKVRYSCGWCANADSDWSHTRSSGWATARARHAGTASKHAQMLTANYTVHDAHI
eukprot:6835098-Alexandrium_andersonii.AAC.1